MQPWSVIDVQLVVWVSGWHHDFNLVINFVVLVRAFSSDLLFAGVELLVLGPDP